MKIKSIQLKNGYKPFFDLTINLGPSPKKIVALVGPNGSGKSSVFDGMLFLAIAYNMIGSAGGKDVAFHSMNGDIIDYNSINIIFDSDKSYSELRKEKTDDIEKVALAFWEPGGTISIFLYPQYQPITPTDLTLAIKPFDFPRTIVKERKIDYNELQRLGKDEKWILHKLKTTNNINVKDVLLATIDSNENLKVFLYK